MSMAATPDRAALRGLYEAQAARLFGIANAILRDRAAAAEAVQEAVLRLAHQAPRGDAAAVTRQAALDLARRHGRESLDAPGLGAGVLAPEALARVLAAEHLKRLHWSLATLEEKPRAGILLGYVHGLSHAQLSARLHLRPETVPAWLRRALLQLRGTDADERAALAGEYVLGSLNARDAAAVSADPALREAVQGWEALLAPLQDLAAPEAPPPELWARIAAALERPAPAAAAPAPAGASLLWRTWAALATGAATVLALNLLRG